MKSIKLPPRLRKYALQFLDFLEKPFLINLPLFSVLLLLQFVQYFIGLFLIHTGGVVLVSGTVAWAYILTLLQGITDNNIWRRCYSSLILTLCSLMTLVQFVVAVKFQELVYPIHLLLIANTNGGEAEEFLSLYLDPLLVTYIFIIAGFLILIFRGALILRNKNFIKKTAPWNTSLAILCIFVCSIFNVWLNCGVGRFIDSLIEMFKYTTPDLEKTQRPFEVEEKHHTHPQNIIIIMGEAFNKSHSSLYEYDKETNPLLGKRERQGVMTVFQDVHSSAASTGHSFRLSFMLTDNINDTQWQTRPTLPTFMRKSDYKTFWLTNQSMAHGLDNTQTSLAILCDSSFCTNSNAQPSHFYPDGLLFEPFRKYIGNLDLDSHNFIVVHLMGSHEAFEKRYPQQFNKFKPSDYPNQKESRRATFAHYDNSVLYNDFVVDSLMKICDSLDAIIFYLPDHGLDFYYTREMACHAAYSNPKSVELACRIPFMIYFTPEFRRKNPELVKKIASYKDERFETKYLMNTIMELSGYGIKGMETESKSLFKGQLYK